MAEDHRSEDDRPEQANPEKRFERKVGRKAARKLRARREADRGAWFWLGMFGLVGWSVAVPTVLGIALGVWLDHTWPGRVSWTLTLLFIGVVVGGLNAWYWIQQESRRE
jgi:ATP synthase protein I